MNYREVFETCKKQYGEMYTWMQSITVSFEVLRENNGIQTIKNGKILKRIARIEDRLKIIDVEELEGVKPTGSVVTKLLEDSKEGV